MARPRNTSVEPTTRIFNNQVTIHHDLFVLAPAMMSKNLAKKGVVPDIERVVHQHFFHTVDSDGRKQNTCSPIGGHFHEITVVTPANGANPPELLCGPPVTYAPVKDEYGVVKRQLQAVPHDTHTHEMIYRKSDVISLRAKSVEAAQFEARSIPVIPAGVSEGA